MKTPTTHHHRNVALFACLACLGLMLAGVATYSRADDAKKNDAHGLGAKPPEGAAVVFNGRDDSGWKFKQEEFADAWAVRGDAKLDPSDPGKLVGVGEGAAGKGVALRGPAAHGSDVYSEQTFGDGEYHVEFMVPKGSNSGVYLQGQYEVQVLDSYGKKDDQLGQGDCGAIYSAAPPRTNATKPPGEWQVFHIVFRAPRFDAAGKKTENAKFISVHLNGTLIQENVEVKGPTGGQLDGGEKAKGPLMFQGDHGVVAYRNIWVKPGESK